MSDMGATPHDGPHASDDAGDPTAVQFRLPFDLDAPIPFTLTARARRTVAPEQLPDLSVLPGDGAVDGRGSEVPDDEPGDTRPARARALRRAGVDPAGIARELGVDEVMVHAWADDVAPVRSARRRLRAVDGGRAAAPTVDDPVDRARELFDRAREQASADAPVDDAAFARGLGLTTGTSTITPHAVVVTSRDGQVAAGVLAWLRRAADLREDRVRVILRVPPQAPGDLTRGRWSSALGVPKDRCSVTRWRAAPDAETVESMIRIADPVLAGRLAGWRDRLLRSIAEGDA